MGCLLRALHLTAELLKRVLVPARARVGSVRRVARGVACAVGFTAAMPHATAAECAPAQIKGDPGALPPPWRDALDALVAATAREGQPWSCPNARVRILPASPRHPTLLEVEDAYGVRRRAVARPMDLVPLGEAMLAALPEEEPASAPPSSAEMPPLAYRPPFETPPEARHGEATSHASVLFDALAGVRYTGPTSALMVGPELRATYGFDHWSAGLVARYDTAVDVFQRVPPQFSMSSVTVGLAAGYRLVERPFELTASIEPTLAVILLGAQRPGEAEPDSDSHVDMRLGARLAASIPLPGRLRVVCALGAEGTPAALFEDRHSRHAPLPELPGYLAGLSVGLQMKANP